MGARQPKAAMGRAPLPLLARKGFAQRTPRDLAGAAGVSEPLLYRHFPSKEALYLEIQDSSCKGTDPVVKRITEMKPSIPTLVHLLYYLMRALVTGRPIGKVKWDTRHRLMLNSLLDDGAFARVLYRTRLDCFCSRMEECLAAGIASAEVVRGPVSIRNRARFAHHVGAWLAAVHLPSKAAMTYGVSRGQLLNQAVWFALRGMGVTDKAIKAHYDPKALVLSMDHLKL